MKINILEPCLQGNEKKYLIECIESNWISSQGEFIQTLEDMVRRDAKDRFAVVTSNGTVALHLALVALGIKTGDEIIVPNVTFGATINSILYTGATPVIADVDINDWNLTSELEKYITPRTKAIMPVALFGNPMRIDLIAEFAEDNDMLCVIDAAEAVGSRINGKDIGNFGDAVTYSYFGNKTITTGEGGAVVFKNPEIYEKAKILRDHGMTPGRRYHHEVLGFNYRMTNMQAAVGVAQYEMLDEILSYRKQLDCLYRKELSTVCTFQQLTEKYNSSNWVTPIKIQNDQRIKIEKNLIKNDIDYRRCFELMSLQPAFKESKIVDKYVNSSELFESVLLLPMHNNLSFEDVKKVCACIHEVI